MHDLPALTVIALATYRLARLIAVDRITDAPRALVFAWAWRDTGQHDPSTPRGSGVTILKARGRAPRQWAYELISCPVCVGPWAAGALYLWWGHVTALRWAVVILAVAGAQCFLAIRDET